jgi:UDP-N-acetylglucosamine 4,6-dehydratase/5-epimerase
LGEKAIGGFSDRNKKEKRHTFKANYGNDMKILITGGTGSLGTYLTKKYLKDNEVVIFSRDEFKQRSMMFDLKSDKVKFIVGDVRDYNSIRDAMKGIDIVIHTAALKHVPVGEEQPEEVIKTNILGTLNVVRACKENGVKKAILTSTDKGCHPINLYGATKLCAEKIFIQANLGSSCKFACVRYGNVIGSRGSIIETILTKKPKKLTITDPRMTRFWITLEQASYLIATALFIMKGGEIFVPKLKGMKMTEVFKILAPDTEIEVTGIRPGEKLYECLVNKDESIHTFEQLDYFVIESELLQEVPNGRQFEYTSENAKQLTKEEFLKLCKSD